MYDRPKSRPNLFQRLGTRWCRMMHDSAMWPTRGHYRCRACGRNFEVPWAGEPKAESGAIRMRPEQRVARRAA